MDEPSEKPPDDGLRTTTTTFNVGALHDLRQDVGNWTLDSEYKLIRQMEDLHTWLLNSSKELVARVENNNRRAGELSVNLASASNNFSALANTQFVESRVQPDTDGKANLTARQNNAPYNSRLQRGSAAGRYEHNYAPTKTTADSERERLEAVRQALQICSKALDDELHITATTDGVLTYELKDRYAHRPLPTIIGTAAFINEKLPTNYGSSTAQPVTPSARLPSTRAPHDTLIRPEEKAAVVGAVFSPKPECDIENDSTKRIAADIFDWSSMPDIPVAAPRIHRPPVLGPPVEADHTSSSAVVAPAYNHGDIFGSSPLANRSADDDRPEIVSSNSLSKNVPRHTAQAALPLLFGDSGDESDDEESSIFAVSKINANRPISPKPIARVASVDANVETIEAPTKKLRERQIIPEAAKTSSNIPSDTAKHDTVPSHRSSDTDTALSDGKNDNSDAAKVLKNAFKASLNATLGRRQQMQHGPDTSAVPTSLSEIKSDRLPKEQAFDAVIAEKPVFPPVRAPSSSGIASSTTSSISATSAVAPLTDVSRGRIAQKKSSALFDNASTDDENEDYDDGDDLFAAVSRRRVVAGVKPALLNNANLAATVNSSSMNASKIINNDDRDKTNHDAVPFNAQKTDAEVLPTSLKPSNSLLGKSSPTPATASLLDGKKHAESQKQRSLNVNSIFNDADSSDADDDNDDLFAALARNSKERRSRISNKTAASRSSPTPRVGMNKNAAANNRAINDDGESGLRLDPDNMVEIAEKQKQPVQQNIAKELHIVAQSVSPLSITPPATTAPQSKVLKEKSFEVDTAPLPSAALATASSRSKPPLIANNIFSDAEDEQEEPGWTSRMLVSSKNDNNHRPLPSLPFSAVSAFSRSPPPDDAVENEDDNNDLTTPKATAPYRNFWNNDDDRDDSAAPTASYSVQSMGNGNATALSNEKPVVPVARSTAVEVPKLDGFRIIATDAGEKTPSADISSFSRASEVSALDKREPHQADFNGKSSADKVVNLEKSGAAAQPFDSSTFDVPCGFYADDDNDKVLHANKSLDHLSTDVSSARLSRSRSGHFTGSGGSSRVSHARLQHLLDRKLKILSKHDAPVDVHSTAPPFFLNDGDLTATKSSNALSSSQMRPGEDKSFPTPFSKVDDTSTVSVENDVPASFVGELAISSVPVVNLSHVATDARAEIVGGSARDAEPPALFIPNQSVSNGRTAATKNSARLSAASDADAVFDPLRSTNLQNPAPTSETTSRAVPKVEKNVSNVPAADKSELADDEIAAKQFQSLLKADRKPFLFDASDDDEDDPLFSTATVAKKRQPAKVATNPHGEKLFSNPKAEIVAENSLRPAVQQVAGASATASEPTGEIRELELPKSSANRAVLHELSDDDDLFATLSRKYKPSSSKPNGAVNSNNTTLVPPSSLFSQPQPSITQPVKSVGAGQTAPRAAVNNTIPKSKSIFGDDDDDSDLFNTKVVKKPTK